MRLRSYIVSFLLIGSIFVPAGCSHDLPEKMSERHDLNQLGCSASSNAKIPKILHQTWKTKHLPANFEKWSATFKKNHPDWEYKLWTDEDNRNFIKEKYPWFLPTYDGYDKHIKRVDAVRYFLLYHYGGVYVDMDFESLKNIEPLLSRCEIVVGEQDQEGSVANAFMASVSGHEFWKEIFNLLEEKKYKHVLQATGPELLTGALKHHLQENLAPAIRVYPPKYFYPYAWNQKTEKNAKICFEHPERCSEVFPQAFAVTHWTHTWKDQY